MDTLKQISQGSDYFADLGNGTRIAAVIVLAPFALFFTLGSLLTPVAAVCIAFKGDWQIAGIVLGSGLIYTVLAIPLCWLEFRLWRGRKSANDVTILPTWLVRTFLVAFLGPVSIGVAVGMCVQAWRAVEDGDWSMSALWAAGACGLIVSLVRGFRTAFRIGKPRADSPPAAT